MFKENTNRIRIITDVDMLLMVEKGLRGGICHVIHRYSKTNNKCMKSYDKKESSYIWYLHGNYLHG